MLLEAAGLAFEIVESGIDEIRHDGESGADFALRMAREKALNVSVRLPDALVLAADTIVECDGHILGKPINAAEARSMLQTLSGNIHTVVTAFAIASAGAISDNFPVLSRVTFRPLSVEEIADYVASGEPFDKAGAYAIQGLASKFVDSVNGCYFNVMGLPLSLVYRHWKALTAAE